MGTTARDDTRRRFIAHFAGIGLGASLAPGVLWARMQDQGAQRITLDMVTDALKLAGIEATEAERQAMVNGANQSLTRYEAIRELAWEYAFVLDRLGVTGAPQAGTTQPAP